MIFKWRGGSDEIFSFEEKRKKKVGAKLLGS
jgi:hypothetical protein